MNEDLMIKKSSFLLKFKNLIFSGVTGLLILVVLFQSFQLQQLKAHAQGFVQVRKAQAVTPVQAGNSGLPSQVGGC